MFFVLERTDKPGCFFPKGQEANRNDYVGELDAAEVFKATLEDGVLKTNRELPTGKCWRLRSVQLLLR